MTGKEIYEMIVEMQQKAKEQGGRLKDIALPEELFKVFQLYAFDDPHITFDKQGMMYVHGTKVHTGEED